MKKVRILYDFLVIIYLITSVVSIILAITSIWFSLSVEKRLKNNFLSLKNKIEFQHNRTEELMKNINQESLNIQLAVYKTQTDIHDNLKNMQKHCKSSNSEKNNEN
jgi:hypothetical protein